MANVKKHIAVFVSAVSVATRFDSSVVSHSAKPRRPSHTNDEHHIPSPDHLEPSALGTSVYPENLAHEVTVVVLGDVELRSDSSSWSTGSRLKFSHTSSRTSVSVLSTLRTVLVHDGRACLFILVMDLTQCLQKQWRLNARAPMTIYLENFNY